MLFGDTAVTCSRTRASRLAFLTTKQNTRWDHSALSQTWQHFAWHSLFIQSLNYRRIYSVYTYALRLVAPTRAWQYIARHCGHYSGSSLTAGSDQHVLQKIRGETINFATYASGTLFICNFGDKTQQIYKSCVAIATLTHKWRRPGHYAKYTSILQLHKSCVQTWDAFAISRPFLATLVDVQTTTMRVSRWGFLA